MKHFLFLIIIFFISSLVPQAQGADLFIPEGSIRISSSELLEGQRVRIYAFATSENDEDAVGSIVFSIQGKTIGSEQFISVVNRRSDDVFIDWIPPAGGYYTVIATVMLRDGVDKNAANNTASLKNFFVDYDRDGDGVGNLKDIDDDNNGIRDEEEKKQVNIPEQKPEQSKGTRPAPVHLPAPFVLPSREEDQKPLAEKRDSFKDATDTDADGISDTLERRRGLNPFVKATGETYASIFSKLKPIVLGVKIPFQDNPHDKGPGEDLRHITFQVPFARLPLVFMMMAISSLTLFLFTFSPWFKKKLLP